MKYLRYLLPVLILTKMTAFVPEIYQKAEIIPNDFLLAISTAGEYHSYLFMESLDEGYGAHVQLSSRFLNNELGRIGFLGYVGVSANTYGLGFPVVGNPEVYLVPTGGFGLQWEFVEKPSLAFQFMAEFPYLLSGTLMCGIDSRKAKREVLTFGLKTFLFMPNTVFLTVRPFPNMYVSCGVTYRLPELIGDVGPAGFHAGIGYSFGRLGAKE